MKHLPLNPDGSTTFSMEDGKIYIGHHVSVERTLKAIAKQREMESMATMQSNPNGWQRVGSVPRPILRKWLRDRGYSEEHYARNEGGNKLRPGQSFYHWVKVDGGVKARFWRWFITNRDFAKLHNLHVTTKPHSKEIWLPPSKRKTSDKPAGIVVPEPVARQIKQERAA